jgi:tRNA (guanine-N7-)-methyltransferase
LRAAVLANLPADPFWHSRAFFGRRKGHRLKAARAALMDTLLPRLALDLGAPPDDLRSLYPNPVQQIRLEIGFGGGEYMISQARAQPHVGFIGIEPFVNGMAKALAAIAAHSLSNIRLHHGDATEVLAWLPPNSLARVEMLYPDPWPKRRHWKRRFVQDYSIAAIGRVLRPDGEFRFATDVADYACWTLRHVLRCPQFEWTAERADDWRHPWREFPGTRYQSKALHQGRSPCYLTFQKCAERK